MASKRNGTGEIEKRRMSDDVTDSRLSHKVRVPKKKKKFKLGRSLPVVIGSLDPKEREIKGGHHSHQVISYPSPGTCTPCTHTWRRAAHRQDPYRLEVGGLRERHRTAGNSIRIDDLLGARISCGPHHLRCWPFISLFFIFFISLPHVADDLSQMFTFGWRKEQNFLIKVLQQHNCFNPAGKYKVSQQTHNTRQGHFLLMSWDVLFDGEEGGCYALESRKRKVPT